MDIVDKDSPLMRVPGNTNPRQVILLDSIRYCANMIGLCYSRLVTGLWYVSKAPVTERSTVPFTPLFVDAWSIVDAAHRMAPLLSALSPQESIRDFCRYASNIRNVHEARHHAHHLQERVDQLVKLGKLAWGSIAWVTRVGDERGTLKSHLLFSGTARVNVNYKVINPFDRTMSSDLDFVTLQAPQTTVDLSSTVNATVDVIRHLEEVLRPQFEGRGTAGTDVYLSLDFVPAAQPPQHRESDSDRDPMETPLDQEMTPT